MKLLVVLNLLVLLEAASADMVDIDKEWRKWTTKHRKSYRDSKEEKRRKQVFSDNSNIVDAHNCRANQGLETFKLELNFLADKTIEEVMSTMTGYIAPADDEWDRMRSGEDEEIAYSLLSRQDVPASLDWRDKGAVTDVKSQSIPADCGACWAFASTGAMESAFFIKNGTLVTLSEQNLIDCAEGDDYSPNNGCVGGAPGMGYKYVKNNGGSIATEDGYAYNAVEADCAYDSDSPDANVDIGVTDFFRTEPTGNETVLLNAVATIGPIAITIDANHTSFQLYSSSTGVYSDPACNGSNPNHAMLVVGYGNDPDGGDYWIIKNSWGTNWGMQGYMWMARNDNNMCGVSNWGVYPTLA